MRETKKEEEKSRKPLCKNANNLRCVCTHTHSHTVTILYLKGAQCVTKGGINYLNLSDLPSFFGTFISSFNHSLSSFYSPLPTVSTHLWISNFSHFFNPSSFPPWSSLPTPCRYMAFIPRCKATASHPSIPPSLPPPHYPPPTECLIFDEEAFEVS